MGNRNPANITFNPVDMPLTPGTYIIHDTDSDWVLAYYSSNNRIGTWSSNQADYEKWYVKCYPGSSKYAIQDMSYKRYIAVAMKGDNPYGMEEEDASVLELEHQFQDFYLIKLAGTRRYLEHPNIKLEKNHTMVNFTNRVPLQGCSWRFERISGDTGSVLRPKPKHSGFISPTPHANTSSQVPGNLLTNDTVQQI
ncbi:unnamed protein product [Rhizoctonia solani]|uniref:Uncharacterized protein n=1 Tax=Rhizoctonia solani TaxID=456999 RepID=A0A8H3HKA1_9AGAM|nr:unnamed protein product [Rhizoctonia solani]